MLTEITPSRCRVQIGWDDVPHLSERAKAELISTYPPHERDARTKGDPSLGSGAIYPVPLDDVLVQPFALPDYWPRAFALDVGWNCTAALWGARNPADDVMYLWGEYYRGQAVPAVHAAAIRMRGEWMRGAIDPAAHGRVQSDGQQLIHTYRDLGLKLVPADNSVDAGIYAVWQRLETGRLKVFRTLVRWQNEYRQYRRDEKGRIVKSNDHLMDDTRYLVMTWEKIAGVAPAKGPRGHVTQIADTRAGY